MPRQYRLDKLEMPDLEAMEPAVRRQVMREGLKVVQAYLRANVPDSGIKHKGKLKKSIRISVQSGGVLGKVKAVAPHAHLVHDGTSPHPISLNPYKHPMSKALGVPGWGAVHSVQHPGSKANPFLLRAADETSDQMEGVMRKAMQEATDALVEGKTP